MFLYKSLKKVLLGCEARHWSRKALWRNFYVSYEYKFHSFIRLRRPSSTGYFSAVMYLGYVNINFVPTFKAELNFKIEFVTPPPQKKKKQRGSINLSGHGAGG